MGLLLKCRYDTFNSDDMKEGKIMRNLMTALFFLFLLLPLRVMAQPTPTGPVGPALQSLTAGLF